MVNYKSTLVGGVLIATQFFSSVDGSELKKNMDDGFELKLMNGDVAPKYKIVVCEKVKELLKNEFDYVECNTFNNDGRLDIVFSGSNKSGISYIPEMSLNLDTLTHLVLIQKTTTNPIKDIKWSDRLTTEFYLLNVSTRDMKSSRGDVEKAAEILGDYIQGNIYYGEQWRKMIEQHPRKDGIQNKREKETWKREKKLFNFIPVLETRVREWTYQKKTPERK